MEFFSDPRYRGERLMMVIYLPLAILAVGGVTWLVLTQDDSPPPRPQILTADQIDTPEDDEMAAVAKTLRVKAGQALEEGNQEAAIGFLRKAIEAGDKPGDAFIQIGMIQMGKEEYAKAIESFSEALELQPSGLSYFHRGECYRHLGDLESALEDLQRAVENNPSDPLASNQRYLVMIQSGKADLVRKSIDLKLNLGVLSDASTWVVAGVALSLIDENYPGAASLLNNALDLLPENEFDYLLGNPLFEKHRDHPLILPYYIRTSTIRQRVFGN